VANLDTSLLIAVVCVATPLGIVFAMRASLTANRSLAEKTAGRPVESLWKNPSPFIVRLPLATAFDTVSAELPAAEFWKSCWQKAGSSSAQGKSKYSAHLKAALSAERSVDLQLNIELSSVDKFSTRLTYAFVDLAGAELDLEQAVTNVKQQLELSLRTKLIVIAILYEIVTAGADLTQQVSSLAHSNIAVASQNCRSCNQPLDKAFAFCLHCGGAV